MASGRTQETEGTMIECSKCGAEHPKRKRKRTCIECERESMKKYSGGLGGDPGERVQTISREFIHWNKGLSREYLSQRLI